MTGHSSDSSVPARTPSGVPHLARTVCLVTAFSGFLTVGLLVAAPLGAQAIVGTLVEAETGVPIEGASVVLLNRNGEQVNWRLTEAFGRFSFPTIQAETYLLRADRIGHASVLSDPITVEPGATVVYRLETPVEPIQLVGIDVTSSSRCEVRPGRGASTAVVWGEARKALEATSRTADMGVYRYVIRHYERELDDRGREVRSEESRIQNGVMANPFLSLDVETLLERGFMHSEKDGFVYYAPDADILLSDPFLDSHCMSLTEGENEAEGLIGLSFEPTEDRGVPDISGILWLDPEDAELRWLDYRYEFLDVPNPEGLRGKIQFYGLPNGTWIVRDWYIRMPLLESTVGPAPARRFRLVGLREQGSSVMSVNNLQGDLVLDSRTGIIEGVVLASEGADPVQEVVVLLDDSTGVTTDEDGRFRFTALAAGYYGLTVFHPDLNSLGLAEEPVFVDVSPGQVTSASLQFASVEAVMTERCGPVEPSGFEGILAGFALDENRNPLPGARVSVAWEEVEERGASIGMVYKVLTTPELPDNAFFLACGLPRDRAVDITVEWNGLKSQPERFRLSETQRVSRRNITLR